MARIPASHRLRATALALLEASTIAAAHCIAILDDKAALAAPVAKEQLNRAYNQLADALCQLRKKPLAPLTPSQIESQAKKTQTEEIQNGQS